MLKNSWKFPDLRNYATCGVSFFLILLVTNIPDKSWAQNILNQSDELITVPLTQGKTIEKIEVKFVNRNSQPVEGKTKPEVILREFDIKPGDIYEPKLAQEGLDGVNSLLVVKKATLSLEPSPLENNVVMVVTVEETNPFFFSFALTLPPPTALQGPARPITVNPESNTANGIAGGIRFGVINLGGTNKALTLGVEGGENSLGFDLDFRDFWRHNRGIAFNFFRRHGVEPEFDNGETEVDLPNGDEPWISRVGGGVEHFFPIAKDFEGAIGLSYRVVSSRDGRFDSDLQPVDEEGNPLTFSDDGQDTLLTINFASARDKRNNRLNPSKGYRILLGMDQSIPIGTSNILYNRLSANYSHFFPFKLFGFTKGDRTLALNLQGGTIIGDLPPYEAFNLGGFGSVRGYTGGDVGTGRSFLKGTLEYRFPIVNFTAFKEERNLGGSLFIDYATDLGSAYSVKGEPSKVRDKPGSGFGYGLGLRLPTDFGTVRLEFAISNQGDTAVYFNIGESF